MTVQWDTASIFDPFDRMKLMMKGVIIAIGRMVYSTRSIEGKDILLAD